MPIGNKFANDKVFFSRLRKPGEPPRKPLKTFRELAEELGVSVGHLSAHMAHSSHPVPQAKLRSNNPRTISNRYYDHAEFMSWWKVHSAEK